MLSGLDFWYQSIGKHIAPNCCAEESAAAVLPTRNAAGEVAPLRIGASGFRYLAMPGQSFVISRLSLPDLSEIRMIPAEAGPQNLAFATLLVDHARGPFMCGEFGKANPVQSFTISHASERAFYCEPGGGFTFNLCLVRESLPLLTPFGWDDAISPALYFADALRFASRNSASSARDKLYKVFDSNPGLCEALARHDIRRRSGEAEVLRWLLATPAKPAAPTKTNANAI